MEPSLPPPPWITYLLLEDPFWIVVALMATGAALYVLAGRMARPVLQKMSAIPVTLAIGLLVLSFLIRTEREALTDRSLAILEWASAPENPPGPADPANNAATDWRITWLEELLDPGLSLQIDKRSFDRKRVLKAAEWVLREDAFSEARIQDLHVHVDHALAGRSLLKLRTIVLGRPAPSTWMLYWIRSSSSDPWRVRQIEWLSFNGQTPMPGMLP